MSLLRAELSSYVDRVRAGEEVVVTDRGVPVARLIGIDSTALIERLTREGVIARPDNAVKRSMRDFRRVTPTAGPPIASLVREDLH